MLYRKVSVLILVAAAAAIAAAVAVSWQCWIAAVCVMYTAGGIAPLRCFCLIMFLPSTSLSSPLVPSPQLQAVLNSLQLRLVATVAAEVLASPLPMLRMLKNTRGSVGAVPGQRTPNHSSAAADMGGIGPAAAAMAMATEGGGWGGMGMGMSPAPTVATAWASKRQADWETLQV